jgi:hypothetical protein
LHFIGAQLFARDPFSTSAAAAASGFKACVAPRFGPAIASVASAYRPSARVRVIA